MKAIVPLAAVGLCTIVIIMVSWDGAEPSVLEDVSGSEPPWAQNAGQEDMILMEVGDTLGLAALRLAAKHTHIAITRQARHVAEIANPVAPHANSVAKIAAARPHLDAIEAMQIVPESRVKPEMVMPPTPKKALSEMPPTPKAPSEAEVQTHTKATHLTWDDSKEQAEWKKVQSWLDPGKVHFDQHVNNEPVVPPTPAPEIPKMPVAPPDSCQCRPPQGCFCTHPNFHKDLQEMYSYEHEKRIKYREQQTTAAEKKLEADKEELRRAKFKAQVLKKLREAHGLGIEPQTVAQMLRMIKKTLRNPTPKAIERAAALEDKLHRIEAEVKSMPPPSNESNQSNFTLVRNDTVPAPAAVQPNMNWYKAEVNETVVAENAPPTEKVVPNGVGDSGCEDDDAGLAVESNDMIKSCAALVAEGKSTACEAQGDFAAMVRKYCPESCGTCKDGYVKDTPPSYVKQVAETKKVNEEIGDTNKVINEADEIISSENKVVTNSSTDKATLEASSQAAQAVSTPDPESNAVPANSTAVTPEDDDAYEAGADAQQQDLNATATAAALHPAAEVTAGASTNSSAPCGDDDTALNTTSTGRIPNCATALQAGAEACNYDPDEPDQEDAKLVTQYCRASCGLCTSQDSTDAPRGTASPMYMPSTDIVTKVSHGKTVEYAIERTDESTDQLLKDTSKMLSGLPGAASEAPQPEAKLKVLSGLAGLPGAASEAPQPEAKMQVPPKAKMWVPPKEKMWVPPKEKMQVPTVAVVTPPKVLNKQVASPLKPPVARHVPHTAAVPHPPVLTAATASTKTSTTAKALPTDDGKVVTSTEAGLEGDPLEPQGVADPDSDVMHVTQGEFCDRARTQVECEGPTYKSLCVFKGTTCKSVNAPTSPPAVMPPAIDEAELKQKAAEKEQKAAEKSQKAAEKSQKAAEKSQKGEEKSQKDARGELREKRKERNEKRAAANQGKEESKLHALNKWIIAKMEKFHKEAQVEEAKMRGKIWKKYQKNSSNELQTKLGGEKAAKAAEVSSSVDEKEKEMVEKGVEEDAWKTKAREMWQKSEKINKVSTAEKVKKLAAEKQAKAQRQEISNELKQKESTKEEKQKADAASVNSEKEQKIAEVSIKEASQKKAAKDESQVKAEKAAAEAEAKATVPPPSPTPEPTPEPTESEKHYKERAAEAMQKLKGVMEHAHEPTEEEKILKEKLCDAQKIASKAPEDLTDIEKMCKHIRFEDQTSDGGGLEGALKDAEDATPVSTDGAVVAKDESADDNDEDSSVQLIGASDGMDSLSESSSEVQQAMKAAKETAQKRDAATKKSLEAAKPLADALPSLQASYRDAVHTLKKASSALDGAKESIVELQNAGDQGQIATAKGVMKQMEEAKKSAESKLSQLEDIIKSAKAAAKILHRPVEEEPTPELEFEVLWEQNSS